MAKKPRIPTDGSAAPINNPFSALSLGDLPPGPAEPAPANEKPRPTKKGRVVLRRETAHRGGKEVIVVHDFERQITASQIEELGRRLRNACGCGGTVRDREIEIQGNQAARLRKLLEAEGFRVAGVT